MWIAEESKAMAPTAKAILYLANAARQKDEIYHQTLDKFSSKS